MAHYFDDIFQRTVETGTPHPARRAHIRRSSTARSIGARSDFVDDDDARSTTASIYPDDAEKAREKEEDDSHMHQYIADQLNRYKTENPPEHDDDLEAKA